MKKIRTFVFFFFIANLLFMSCKEKGYAIINIKGSISNSQGQYLDSLMITATNLTTKTSDSFLSGTGKEGFDRTYIFEKEIACNYLIQVEDIDGERNGGFYQEQSTTVTIRISDYGYRNDLLVQHPYVSKEVNFVLDKKY